REPARDLGLAHTGRADQQDVLGRDLLPQRVRDLLAPPSISQRYRNGSFRSLLADDVLVELMHDLGWRHDERHGGLGRRGRGRKRLPRLMWQPSLFYRVAHPDPPRTKKRVWPPSPRERLG